MEDVVANVCAFDEEDGARDIWRRSIMKFYSRLNINDYRLYKR